MLAAYTGLRRGEIKQLTWADVHLDEERPFILARASTTKNKKTAVLPLVPQLVQRLKDWREQQHTLTGTVFKRSVPTAVTLLKDLAACGIKGVDEHGRHLDSLLSCPRIRDITSDRFALVKTSGIQSLAIISSQREPPFNFILLVRKHPVIKPAPLRVAAIQFFVG